MNPNSLCSQVLSTRYLQNLNLMEATTPRVASRTWRSILVGMDALKIGLVKRVGSSESIFIWDDCWNAGTTIIRTMGRQHATEC
jgi:hypothetical protein